MRAADPVSGVPEVGRYSETNITERGDAGLFLSRAITLEEEAYLKGWTPGMYPTGPEGKPIGAVTAGMRGEESNGMYADSFPEPDGIGYTNEG